MMADARMPDEFFDELSQFRHSEKPIGNRGDRPPIPHRIIVKVIWFVLVTGCRWEDVPWNSDALDEQLIAAFSGGMPAGSGSDCICTS